MIIRQQYIPNKRIVLLLGLALFLFVLVPFMAGQNRYLSSGLQTSRILSAQYVLYEPGRVLTGPILAAYRMERSSAEELFARFEQQNAYQAVSGPPEASVYDALLLLSLEDGSVVACYTEQDLVGIDFGSVWLKNDALPALLEELKAHPL